MSEAIRIAGVDEVAEGEALLVSSSVTGRDDDIALFHAEDGQWYALDDTCTHETASLAEGWVEGTEVECPRHAARFCLKTGAALCMPATVAARTHAVEVRGDDVVLLPED